MNELQRFTSPRLAARMLGVSHRTVYNWMRDGKLKYVIIPSGLRRILIRDLLRDGNDTVDAALKRAEV